MNLPGVESEFGGSSITKALTCVASSFFGAVEIVPSVDEVVVRKLDLVSVVSPQLVARCGDNLRLC